MFFSGIGCDCGRCPGTLHRQRQRYGDRYAARSNVGPQADIFWEQVPSWIKNKFTNQIGPQYDDWRLPTLSELESLYLESPDYNGYETQCGHNVKMVPAIKISCILVWTSDTVMGLPLAFNYYLGNPFTVDLTDKNGCRVLPVRRIK